MDGALRQIMMIVDEAYGGKSWHGTALRGSIRGVSPAEAAWRPGRGRHNIREIVIHAAYWKYAVRRRLSGDTPGSFPLKGSNWFVRPARREETTWAAETALLETEHAVLHDVIASLAERDLRRRAHGSRFTCEGILRGIAAHDLYHAGQIQLIKRLMR
jgi:hypothetical protein